MFFVVKRNRVKIIGSYNASFFSKKCMPNFSNRQISYNSFKINLAKTKKNVYTKHTVLGGKLAVSCNLKSAIRRAEFHF